MRLLAPLCWRSQDDSGAHIISVFGRLEDGRSATARFEWKPRFYVQAVGALSSATQQQALMDKFPNRDFTLSRPIRRTSIYGFCNGRVDTFLVLAFRTEAESRRARGAVEALTHTTFESAVKPLAQFLHDADIRPNEWITLSGEQQLSAASRVSYCDCEFLVRSHTNVRQASEPPTSAVPWVLASWDLETYSPDGRFPDPDNIDCPIIQIGVTFERYQRPGQRKVVVTTTPCDPVEGVEIVSADGEAAALQAFATLLQQEQVDILVSWNGFGFDNRYLFLRAVQHDIDADLFLSKLKSCPLTSRSFKLKQRELFLLDLPGILEYDAMHHLRNDNRFDSYKLDSVASAVTGQHKVDLPYDEMFQLHRDGLPSGQARIASYCSTDCDLPLLIMSKMALLPNILAMSNVCRTPPDLILTKGQVRFSVSYFTRLAQRLKLPSAPLRLPMTCRLTYFDTPLLINIQLSFSLPSSHFTML